MVSMVMLTALAALVALASAESFATIQQPLCEANNTQIGASWCYFRNPITVPRLFMGSFPLAGKSPRCTTANATAGGGGGGGGPDDACMFAHVSSTFETSFNGTFFLMQAVGLVGNGMLLFDMSSTTNELAFAALNDAVPGMAGSLAVELMDSFANGSTAFVAMSARDAGEFVVYQEDSAARVALAPAPFALCVARSYADDGLSVWALAFAPDYGTGVPLLAVLVGSATGVPARIDFFQISSALCGAALGAPVSQWLFPASVAFDGERDGSTAGLLSAAAVSLAVSTHSVGPNTSAVSNASMTGPSVSPVVQTNANLAVRTLITLAVGPCTWVQLLAAPGFALPASLTLTTNATSGLGAFCGLAPGTVRSSVLVPELLLRFGESREPASSSGSLHNEPVARNVSVLMAPSQGMWLASLNVDADGSWLTLTALPEFSAFVAGEPVSASLVSALNPLGLAARCANGSEWLSKDGCVPRPRYRHATNGAGLELKLGSLGLIGGNATGVTLPTQSKADTQWWTLLLATMGGESGLEGQLTQLLLNSLQNTLVVVLPGARLSVFAAQERLGTAFGLELAHMNEFAFPGQVRHVDVTANGVYLFVIVSRERWELDSKTRLLNICERLTSDPTDPFLQSYTPLCASYSSIGELSLPGLFDFVHYVSSCPAFCPSWTENVVAKLPPGFWPVAPNQGSPCTPGSFCADGLSITACPPGFVCPDSGMALPLRCAVDPLGASTCFQQGLLSPVACPTGAYCPMPYDFPQYAPPGYMSPANGSRALLVPCQLGQWCSLARSQAESPAALLCPASTWCANASLIEPLVCACSADLCSYCPPGTYEPTHLCPAGSYCPGPNVTVECLRENYCPAGSTSYSACPAGWVCPTPAVKFRCPAGHYCPVGSTVALRCPWLTLCPEGTSNTRAAFAPVLALVLAFAALVVAVIVKSRRAEERERREKLLRAMHKASLADLHHDDLAWLGDGNRASETFADFEVIGFMPRARAATVGAVSDADGSEHSPLLAPAELASRAFVTLSAHQHAREQSTSARESGGSYASLLNATRPPPQQPPHRSINEPTGETHDEGQRTNANERFLGFMPKSHPIDIEFRELGLTLKSGQSILAGVTGELRHGRITAVLGPSGAGKSTLLTTIANRNYSDGVRTGELLINGEADTLSSYKDFVGFVPQEDVCLRMLTVEENIQHAAALRLPAGTRPSERKAVVREILETLDLFDVRHSVIGDENRRGISGGQRKRVNVALELVGDVTVLFLDEPTSGLDATASMALLRVLRETAERLRLTIATVIHQPRFEIFNMFHDVLLLGKGGRTVYLGPSEHAVGYFASVGFPLPPAINPPDFFLDVIAGDVRHERDANWSPTQLFDDWTNGGLAFIAAAKAAQHTDSPDAAAGGDGSDVSMPAAGSSVAHAGGTRELVPFLELDAAHASPWPASQPRRRPAPSMLWHTFLFARRALIQQSRVALLVLLDAALVLVAGLFVGIVFVSFEFQGPPPAPVLAMCPAPLLSLCTQPLNNPLPSVASLVSLSVALTAVAAALRVFGGEHAVFLRERQAGSSAFAYFLGKNLGHLPELLAFPLVFLTPFYQLAVPRASFFAYYVILVSIHFAATSFGMLCSVIIPASMAQLAAVVSILASMMFSGARPTLPEIARMTWPLPLFPYFSFLRYAQEALVVLEIGTYKSLYPLSVALGDLGYCEGASCVVNDVASIVMIGLAVRACAFLALVLKDRKKQR